MSFAFNLFISLDDVTTSSLHNVISLDVMSSYMMTLIVNIYIKDTDQWLIFNEFCCRCLVAKLCLSIL